MMYVAMGVFAAAYVLMLIFTKYRPYIALGAALIFIVSGMLPISKVVGAYRLLRCALRVAFRLWLGKTCTG